MRSIPFFAGSPAHAGIDHPPCRKLRGHLGFPRTRGDRPYLDRAVAMDTLVPPLTRALGGTLEFRFPLPKQANAGGRPSRKSRARHDSNLAVHCVNRGKPIGTVTANIAEPNKLQRTHLTREKRNERARALAVEHRQRRKALGLCRDCPHEAIPDQTHCRDCSEKHRRSNKRR